MANGASWADKDTPQVVVGVLALQGSFREHVRMLNSIADAVAIEVRTKEELDAVDGLVIPGGESTTMALLAEEWGLLEELKTFAETDKPIWGTCAGLIFLARSCTAGAKEGGQALIGTLDVEVHRNFFGSQIHSFEAKLPCPAELPDAPGYDRTFRAVFIRAPAIMWHDPQTVQVLATYNLNQGEKEEANLDSVVVAVRQGKLMATAFHPEITSDPRWHMLFVNMVREATPESRPFPPNIKITTQKPHASRPADLPIY